MDQKKYYVYMLTNTTNKVLYAGVTSNLAKRIYQHRNKLIQGFTAKYNINKLIYYEVFDEPAHAITREKQIKNLVRRKKDDLVNSFNPRWNDLYGEITK